MIADSAKVSAAVHRRFGGQRVRLIGLIFAVAVLIAIVFYCARHLVSDPLKPVRTALAAGDVERAQVLLEQADASGRDQAEVEFLAARICRRHGRLLEFEQHLDAAARLGWPKDELALQKWLAQAQSGDVDAVEAHLKVAIDKGLSDEFAEETYEALCHGYLAQCRLREAWGCLDYWLQWRPNAPSARLLRAEINDRQINYHDAIDDYRVVLQQLPRDRATRIKLANALIRVRKLDEARAEFTTCLEWFPDDAEALLGLVDVQRQLGNFSAAEQHLDSAMALSLSRAQRARVMGAKGFMLLSNGHEAEALAVLKHAVSLAAPDDTDIRGSLARALAATGQQEEAKLHLDRVMRIDRQRQRQIKLISQLINAPKNPDLRFEIGMGNFELGRVTECMGWLQSALRYDPGHQPTLDFLHGMQRFREGLAAHDQQDFDAVTKAARDLSEVKPLAQHQALLLGLNTLGRMEMHEAINHFENACEHPETQILAYTHIGETYYKLKQYRQAELALRIAISLNHQHTDAHRWLAATYHDIGAMDDALRELAVIVEQAPTDPRPYRLIGSIQKDFEFYDKAIQAYQESLRIDSKQPDNREIRHELAECLIKQRAYAQAVEVIQSLPRDTTGDVLAGQCLHALGDRDAARRLVDAALKAQPLYVPALQLSATLDVESGRPGQAVRSLEKAVELDPKQWQLRYQLSQAYQRADQPERAAEQQQQMRELRSLWEQFSELHKKAIAEPENAQVRVKMGLTALALDQRELAVNWFSAALGIDPSITAAREQLEKLARQSNGS